MQGVIFNIKGFAIHDGPGIRTTVFFKGCPLRCPWCHNPESYQRGPQKIIKRIKKGDREVLEKETVGELVESEEVFARIIKDRIFYDESGGGVTFSGGEPLLQTEFLSRLLSRCKAEGIHTTLDTCGHTTREKFNSIINKVDLFLYDLKFMDPGKHRKFTGMSNKQILENLRLLSENRKRIFIRFVVIPGITDTRENLSGIYNFLSRLKGVEEVDILPYHKLGAHKYKRLNIKKSPAFKVPSKKEMESVKNFFKPLGIKIKTGG